jgi:NAD(P)-dependent dehydrogenase (short-subunit alcohol dehydrogenase family)
MKSAVLRLEGKVVIVTGAASGIGADAARALALEGARVVLSDRDAEGGAALANEIEKGAAESVFVPHDVALEDDWLRVVAAAQERFGRIDVLINNAGISGGIPLFQLTLEAWRRVMSINLDGAFLGLRHVCPVMAETGGGSVINVASVLGKVGQAGGSAYCASKGGVTLLTKAAALELAPLGIRVNSLHPGFVETPMVMNARAGDPKSDELRKLVIAKHALGRLGQPREISDGIVFLASDESSFMTGSELVIDGATPPPDLPSMGRTGSLRPHPHPQRPTLVGDQLEAQARNVFSKGMLCQIKSTVFCRLRPKCRPTVSDWLSATSLVS